MIASLKGITQAMRNLIEADPSSDKDFVELCDIFLRASGTYDAAHEALARGDKGEFDRLRKEADDLAAQHKVMSAVCKAKLNTIH